MGGRTANTVRERATGVLKEQDETKFNTTGRLPNPAGRPAAPVEWTNTDVYVVNEGAKKPESILYPGWRMGNDGIPYEIVHGAIVIKSISFAIDTEEKFKAEMEKLNIPTPDSFNYYRHPETGAWNGVAFANYKNALDAAVAVSGLHKTMLAGRPLVCELKRKQTPQEIEKREAKRAQRRMADTRRVFENNNPSYLPSFNKPSLTRSTSVPALSALADPARYNNLHNPMPTYHDPLASKIRQMEIPAGFKEEIEATLHAFQRNPGIAQIVFPAEYTPKERAVIHLLAKSAGLEHGSVGEHTARKVIVSRTPIIEATGSTASHNNPTHNRLLRMKSHSQIQTSKLATLQEQATEEPARQPPNTLRGRASVPSFHNPPAGSPGLSDFKKEFPGSLKHHAIRRPSGPIQGEIGFRDRVGAAPAA